MQVNSCRFIKPNSGSHYPEFGFFPSFVQIRKTIEKNNHGPYNESQPGMGMNTSLIAVPRIRKCLQKGKEAYGARNE